MAITYTWKITGLNTKSDDTNTNVIVQTRWEKIGTDENGNTGTFMGATPFDFNLATQGSSFTPIEQLTEAQVLSWIQAIVIGDYEAHVNQKILGNIQKKISPIVEATLPWAT